MSFFHGSNRFAIEGGNFSSIGRDQHVSIVQCSHREERKRTISDQYQQIPTWRVYLKRKIAETEVQTCEKGWTNLKACRTISTARIHDGDKDEEFLYVQYRGRDAAKACKLDFDTFSAVKDTNSLQLFGYSNMNALPALVFYNALIPLSHIWERNNFSPLLHTYFSYQGVVVQGLDCRTVSEELWQDPRTGFLCKGPFVRHSININHELADLPTILDQCRPSLTIQTYSEADVLFKYLKRSLSISDIIRAIRISDKAIVDHPNDEDANSILSFLPGTIYHRTSQEIIARYPEDREIWYYEFGERHSIIPDALQGTAFIMDDGSVRFTLKPSDMRGPEPFELRYGLRPSEVWNDFATSWSSQAHGILSQLGIGEDEWEEYPILYDFQLCFERDGDQETSSIRTDVPDDMQIYIFIRPIPRPCDDEGRWDSWQRNPKYYWSSDSSLGAEEMSEDEQLTLGLPAFATKIKVWHRSRYREAYDVLEMIHRSQGFEPTSMELATAVGYTILEVAGTRKPRIEELNGDYVDGIVEAMDIDSITSTFSTLNVDPGMMIIDEIAIRGPPMNYPSYDDAMEVD